MKRYRDHENSSQMADILNRVLPKPIPKNYHKENLQLMKIK